MDAAVNLVDLLRPFAAAPGLPPALIKGLTLDSRQVSGGDLFVALAGHQGHGLQWAGQAVERGCAAIVYEPADPMPRLPVADLPMVPVPDLRAHVSALAGRFFGNPSEHLPVIGVTGTNGKSSCVEFLASVLNSPHGPAGTLGTLGSGLPGQRRKPSTLTTPDAITFQRELARMRAAGARVVVAEVSSHALDQQRVAGVHFQGAVFTNLSRDHLDYHGDMERYATAKARLFADFDLNFAIVNLDDPYGRAMAKAAGAGPRVIGFGMQSGDVRATNIECRSDGFNYQLVLQGRSWPVASALLGRFNISNSLAVAACLMALGEDSATIATSIAQLRPPPGRLQLLGGGDSPLVVVDYAHTPDALESALGAVREHNAGHIVCVFGCGGDRDRGKRPLMGAVAERLADTIVLTDDNPRLEDPDAIIADIVAGIRDRDKITITRDRRRAIGTAVSNTGQGDSVLIAGKGHEDYQEINGRREPFDDREVAALALEAAA